MQPRRHAWDQHHNRHLGSNQEVIQVDGFAEIVDYIDDKQQPALEIQCDLHRQSWWIGWFRGLVDSILPSRAIRFGRVEVARVLGRIAVEGSPGKNRWNFGVPMPEALVRQEQVQDR